MSKCLVSWCPEHGLDTGLLPGLCVEHRDQTLAKQQEALESTRNAAQHVPQLVSFLNGCSTDSWSGTGHITRRDGSCDVLGCRYVGVRRANGKVLCDQHEPKRLEDGYELCDVCEDQLMSAHRHK